MMFNKDNLELILEKHKGNAFKATTPSFPVCKGIGLSENDAIEKLCNSIAYFISKTTKNMLKTKLTNKNYCEIITNPVKSKEFQHRIYNLNESNKMCNSKKIYLKSIEDHLESLFSDSHHSEEELEKKLKELGSFLTGQINESDNTLFGINLCLN